VSRVEKSVFTEEYKVLLRELRQAREMAGLTQQQLAERLQPSAGLSSEDAQLRKWQTQRFVSRCETGQRRIDVLELRALCRAIGIPYIEFLQKLDSALD
jgi:transcriptional regulator with XRE-family HTH domain